MKHINYDESRAVALRPLLTSIGTEIRERTERLEELESWLEEESQNGTPNKDVAHLVAEAAAHRRGLRLAKGELEHLGCSVVGMEPITFRIPGRVGQTRRSFVWQAEEALK